MRLEVHKGWFGRWRVYSRHSEGNYFWLGTFRHREHAIAFINTFYPIKAQAFAAGE